MHVNSRKLTRAETKRHNRQLVLKVIYHAGEISRAGIARATCLTRTTVSLAVAELLEQGLVQETGQGPSAGGKPPTLLRLVDNAHHLIGIDLAGFELQGAVFDLRGRRLHGYSLPLNGYQVPETLNQVFELTDHLIARADRPLLGVGLGSPGLIDARRGVIQRAVNLGWQDLPMQDLLVARYDLPIHLVSDSQAAALAEYTFAKSNGLRDMALILVDRGISAGLIINGQLYQGSSHSGASEIGHIRVVEDGKPCPCGGRGCLETVVSQQALVDQARDVYIQQPASALHDFARDVSDVNLEKILQAYRVGDQATTHLVERLGRYLGIAATNLVATLNIPLVVLAGSVAQFGDFLAEIVRNEIRQRSLTSLASRTEVRVSALGKESVMLGAGALVLSRELGVV